MTMKRGVRRRTVVSLSRGMSGTSARSTSATGWPRDRVHARADQVGVRREGVDDVDPIREQPQPKRQAVDRELAVRAPRDRGPCASRARGRSPERRGGTCRPSARRPSRSATVALQVGHGPLEVGLRRVVEEVGMEGVQRREEPVEIGLPTGDPILRRRGRQGRGGRGGRRRRGRGRCSGVTRSDSPRSVPRSRPGPAPGRASTRRFMGRYYGP